MSTDLSIMVPFKFEAGNEAKMLDAMIEMKQKWGISRFLLMTPDKKIRISGCPNKEIFIEFGNLLQRVKTALEPLGIEVGWWCLSSLKTGKSNYQNIIGLDGITSVISSCPLDAEFAAAFCENISIVAKIANPFMILIEDDYELSNHPGIKQGCFCPLHLKAFSEQIGHIYSREELAHIFKESRPESIKLRQKWGDLSRTSLTNLAVQIRNAVNQVSPETRIGLCQPGCCDRDGDMTEAVVQALAGDKTRPAVRLYGTSYSSNDSGQGIPGELFHALYSAQHLPNDFELFHETDTYPHTRYFSSATRIECQLHNICAYGLDGTFFHATQNLDNPLEEEGYLNMLANNAPRFNSLIKQLELCHLDGCEVIYRPNGSSAWASVLGRYGIPYTTINGGVKLLSGITASILSDAELEKLLSGGLFLDAEAAHIIAERGYKDCIGVNIEKSKEVKFNIEQICPTAGLVGIEGEKIYNFIFAAAAGEKCSFYELEALPGTETLTEFLDPSNSPVQPGLTRYTNRLGGRVAVIAFVLDGINSSSIFCYRKKELIRQLLEWLNNNEPLPVAVLNAPNIFVTFNRHKQGNFGILTVSNLCTDSLLQMVICCHPQWVNGKITELNHDGDWEICPITWNNNNCTLPGPFELMRTRVFKIHPKN